MMVKVEIPGCTQLNVLAALLSVLMASASAFEIVMDPPIPRVGESVLFNVTGINEDLRFSEWYEGEGIPAENQIIRYNNGGGSINRGGKFFNGVEIYANGSLVIRNVTKKMEGPYTVLVQGFNKQYQKTVSLTVRDQRKPGPDSGLSKGAIAGICIAVLVLIVAIIVGVICFKKSKDSGPL